ncbi:MAG TPA: MlaD family protein, partial [Solirubrobacteraceae bacterium]|nr:MlaD family protein [Solirubrobacteraceae bacterium]
VFLAYNANNGLPFVPVYELKADVPNATNLVKGNDVRIGGSRVGVVSAIRPRKHRDGRVSAVLTLKLQTTVEPLPRNSTLIVRSRSALGLKYVEIALGERRLPGGRAAPSFRAGDTIPLANAKPEPVEIDQVFNTFDQPTRQAAQENLREFGNALAGRGASLNEAIEVLPQLLPNLERVMRNLADPRTELARFFVALNAAASEVAPVAEQQAQLFVNLDVTFRALAEVARPYIQESISGGPPALDEAIRDFPFLRVFLANNEALFRELRPGVAALRRAAPDLAGALEIGTPTLIRSQILNRRLIPLFQSLERFASDPQVPMGVRGLTRLVRSLDPTLRSLTPAQTVCNYATLFFRNTASLLSEGDVNGTWQRFIVVLTPGGPNNPNNESGPSSAPANGPSRENHLHANPYPNTASPGQPRECEAANEPYLAGRTVIGNVPGTQSATTEQTRRDPSIPGGGG